MNAAAVPGPGDPTLNLSRAFGEPALRGQIRRCPSDFRVTEIPSVTPDGQGEHLLLRVEKTAANTDWVAGQLARALGIRQRDIGYAGRKDRHAVSTQWFSAWLPGTEPDAWRSRLPPGIVVLEQHRHGRKLRVGALSGNRFAIVVRGLDDETGLLEQRAQHVAAEGVPNYFGPQRFGREGANLVAASRMFQDTRWRKGARKRGMLLSAARAFLFNAVLERRVAMGSWNSLLDGDVASLDGSRSVFAVAEVDEALRERVVRMDIHPSGPMWGQGELMSAGQVADLERDMASRHQLFAKGLEAAGLTQSRRSLRMPVSDLEVQREVRAAEIRFVLPAGGFATSVLRELIHWEDAARPRAAKAAVPGS